MVTCHPRGWKVTWFPMVMCAFSGSRARGTNTVRHNANLQYWKAPKDLNRRTARWHADLQEYDYEIKHIPGKANTPADALSRPPDADQGEQDNKNVMVIPPHKFVNLAIADDITPGALEPNEGRKREIMIFAHTHPSAGHPGRDETIQKARQIQSWPRMTT